MAELDLTRPIIGIENRSAQEVFDIMCDRFKHATPTPDQTNAEVSDERLREARLIVNDIARTTAMKHREEGRTVLAQQIDDALDELTRRSVTSQASEGEVEPAAWQWKQVRGHTWRLVESEHGRAALAAKPDLYELRPLYASPVSKRVERLETLIEAIDAEVVLPPQLQELVQEALQGGRS